jgi:hypothetical protein
MKLEAVGVTEHRPPAHDQLKSALEDAGVVLLPGREVTISGAHVLVFSQDEAFLSNLRPLLMLEEPALRREDVALVWAHPAAPAGSSAYPPSVFAQDSALIETVHAIEVLNGRHLHFEGAVSESESLAVAYGLGMTGGSDAHKPTEVGRCFTHVECKSEDGVPSIIDAIRSGRIQPVLSQVWASTRRYDYRPSLRRFLG